MFQDILEGMMNGKTKKRNVCNKAVALTR